MVSRIRIPSPLSVSRALNTLLEGSYWLPSLTVRTGYSRRQDDTDGDRGPAQTLTVALGPDGDAWVLQPPPNSPDFRFRTHAGGGQSPRVRNALLVLAEAIRRDNEDRPQPTAPDEHGLR